MAHLQLHQSCVLRRLTVLRWCKANNSNIQCSSMLQSHGSFLQVWLYPQYPQYCIPSCFAVCLKLSEILPGLDDISDSWNGDRSLCNVRRQNNFPTPRCWYDRSSVLVACNSCQVQRRWPATATGGQLQQLGGEPWRSLLKHKLLGQVKTGPARTTSSQHIFAFSACLLIERQGGVYWSYQEVLHLGHDWSLLMSNDNHWKSTIQMYIMINEYRNTYPIKKHRQNNADWWICSQADDLWRPVTTCAIQCYQHPSW